MKNGMDSKQSVVSSKCNQWVNDPLFEQIRFNRESENFNLFCKNRSLFESWKTPKVEKNEQRKTTQKNVI